MAEPQQKHAFGQMVLHPEGNGAALVIHTGKELEPGVVQWGPDATAEMRWHGPAGEIPTVEKILGPKDYAKFMDLLKKLREGAHSTVKALQDSSLAPHE